MAGKSSFPFRPEQLPPPGETLLETMDALGMTQADLASRAGLSKQTINRIIKGQDPITPQTALMLETVLGVPASFWSKLERNYRELEERRKEREALARQADWLKSIPVREMARVGWIEKLDNAVDQAREVLRFFGIASPEQWKVYYLSQQTSFRRSSIYENHPAATAAWLRKGELAAAGVSCAPFDQDGFRHELRSARELTVLAPQRALAALQARCAKWGVAVVQTPNIKGTPICGATRWVTPKKAVVQLSLRYKWEDVMWFTFFHEAGHILKHGKSHAFLEGGKATEVNEHEREADAFARDLLIPPRQFKEFTENGRHHEPSAVKAFAREIGVCPAIVVGRLQHEGLLPRNKMNHLRRRFDVC